MTLTETELDEITEIQCNLDANEVARAIALLSTAELVVLKAEASALLNRQMEIIKMVEERLAIASRF